MYHYLKQMMLDAISFTNVCNDALNIPSKFTRTYKDNDIISTGKFENFFIKVYKKDGAVFIHGSLPEYYLRSNLYTLEPRQIDLSVEKLSDELGLNIRECKIKKVEFGNNLVLKYPAADPLTCLVCHPRRTTAPFKNRKGIIHSVYFLSVEIIQVLYDKLQERQRHRKFIPSEFQNKNIIRYEIRFKNFARFSAKHNMTVGELTTHPVYVTLLNQWKNDYFQIKKRRKIITNKTLPRNKSEYVSSLLANYLSDSDVFDEALSVIDSMEINRLSQWRLRDYVRKLSCSQQTEEVRDAVAELDNAIMSTYEEQLSSL